VKYKPPKHKPTPIEDLLPHSKHILLTLLDGGIHINAVFRKLQQTGFSYKRDVLDAIKYLKKAELISKNQSPDNSTKVMIELTELGEKAVNMIASIERYTLSWSNLDKAVTQQFDIPHIR
jgi:DNA-binding HxlR family transcriptional regulator